MTIDYTENYDEAILKARDKEFKETNCVHYNGFIWKKDAIQFLKDNNCTISNYIISYANITSRDGSYIITKK